MPFSNNAPQTTLNAKWVTVVFAIPISRIHTFVLLPPLSTAQLQRSVKGGECRTVFVTDNTPNRLTLLPRPLPRPQPSVLLQADHLGSPPPLRPLSRQRLLCRRTLLNLGKSVVAESIEPSLLHPHALAPGGHGLPPLADPQVALSLSDQPCVVGNHHDTALELFHTVDQSLDGFHVEMIRRFVQHQHLRPLQGEGREDDARLLPPG